LKASQVSRIKVLDKAGFFTHLINSNYFERAISFDQLLFENIIIAIRQLFNLNSLMKPLFLFFLKFETNFFRAFLQDMQTL